MELDQTVPSMNLPLDTLVSVAALVVFAIYLIYSAILYYHWDTYGTDDKVKSITLIFYLIATVPLIIIVGVTALIF
jgi:hypothetical protein